MAESGTRADIAEEADHVPARNESQRLAGTLPTDRVAERNSGHGCANGDLSSGDVTAAAHLAVP